MGKKLDLLNVADYVRYQYEFQTYAGNVDKWTGMFGGDMTSPDFYTAIEYANVCIRGIEGMEQSSENKRLLGEAYAIRAAAFLNLVRYWGDVPYPTVPVAEMGTFLSSRVSRDIILDGCVADLQKAAELIPWKSEISGFTPERYCKESAYGGGRHGRIDMTDNYYKPGPATHEEKRCCLIDASEDGTSRCYLSRNILEGCDAVTRDNSLGLCEHRRDSTFSDRPFGPAAEYDEDAFTAYRRVLEEAGCSHRRDAYDRRVVKEVRRGRFKPYGASFDGGGNGIIDSQEEVGGWPVLRSGKAPKDSDGDGIPDRWERRHSLDPANPADGTACTLNTDYTNLEVYLESILHKNY